MKQPRVTIGLPVYQGEAFIDDAIQSIREQTFSDFELIISDNASTDRTEEISRRHQADDSRIVYDRLSINRGASENFCRLVGLARGDYFKWASHDDIIRPHFLERCVAILDADPRVVLSHTGTATIDSSGVEFRYWPANWNAMDGTPARRFADIVFREGPCFPLYGLMRREVLEKTGMLGPYNGHDRPFLAEMALHGRFAHIPEILFLNREHSGSAIHAYSGSRERIAWFDPAMTGKVVYYHPRLFLEFNRAIGRSDVQASQAILARLSVAVWTAARTRRIARDFAGGLKATIGRFGFRKRGRQHEV